MAEVSAREALSQAIRYWEPRRLLYNAVLLMMVAAVFVLGLPVGTLIGVRVTIVGSRRASYIYGVVKLSVARLVAGRSFTVVATTSRSY